MTASLRPQLYRTDRWTDEHDDINSMEKYTAGHEKKLSTVKTHRSIEGI